MEVGLVLAWTVSLVVLTLLALPVAAWVFPRGDHGAYALTVAVVVVGVVGHLVGHLAYRLPALVAGVCVLVGLAGVAWRRVSIDWRGAAEAMAVFLAAFALMVGLRAIEPSAGTNPHWVGEMFLDFGLLSALERADTLPPEDMWFAGEGVRYHYGGHLLTSLLAGLSGAPPAYAYNLGLATFFGALVTTAWGVGGSIARPMAVPTRLAAGFGAFFVAFAGNLETALRVVAWMLPQRAAEQVADAVGADPAVAGWTPGDFFYWNASRVITRQVTAATEFPLFSWLHGDLHAHVLVKPLLLLVVAVGVAYWYTPPTARRRRLALLVGVLPPIVGLVAVVNMWSVPVVAGLVAVVLLFAPGDPIELVRPGTGGAVAAAVAERFPADGPLDSAGRAAAGEGVRIAASVALAAAVLGIAIGWSAPYWWAVVLGGPGESVAVWEGGTPVGMFLVVQGAFVVGFGAYLGVRLAGTVGRPLAVVAAVAAVLVGFTLVGWAVLGLVLVLLAAAWWLLRRDGAATDDGAGPDGVGPETMLVVAGLGIVLIVELVKLEGDSFNSIFKPYADVWQLWAVALGVIAARFVHGWPRPDLDRSRVVPTAATVGLVVVLVLATGTYGLLAIPAHVDGGNSWSDASSQVHDEVGYTLDATAYVDVLYPTEAAAIDWLDERDGRPTIVTAVPSWYFWQPFQGDGAAAPASLTGSPTVVGWGSHQSQYRGGALVDERESHVETIFTGGPDEQAELLEHYGIDYVYVGPAERATWADITVDEVAGVSVAAEFHQVTIYEVDLGDTA